MRMIGRQLKLVLFLALVVGVLSILAMSTEVFGKSGGVGNSDREYNCGGDSCHDKSEDRSNSAVTLKTDSTELEVGEEITVIVEVTGAETDEPDALMGVFLIRQKAESESKPTKDGWKIVSDPTGTSYNFHEKAQDGDGGSWSWTLEAPQTPGNYTLYAREHHNNGGKHWQDSSEGLEFRVSDTREPALIDDLYISDPTESSLGLAWTAVGDDGHQGTATAYVLRYSTANEITEENWNDSLEYSQEWVPLEAAGDEQKAVEGLDSNTSYWFAIRAFDDANNYGPISNSPNGTTLEEPQNLKGPVNLSLTPSVGTLEENQSKDFTLSVEYNGSPLDNVSITARTVVGSFDTVARLSAGVYKLPYSAGAVEENSTETLNITVKKSGYETSWATMIFTVLNNHSSPDPDPEPGNETGLDGIISPGEYQFEKEFKGGTFAIHWVIEGDSIKMALVGETSGWVSLGLDPSKAMDKADMILGWVDSSGEVFLFDAYSTGPTGPHPTDISLGGTDDILAFGGAESGGRTVIEFTRELDTGDQYDKIIPVNGRVEIIWATGSSDRFDAMHGEDGSGRLDFGSGEGEEDDDVELWPVHALLLTVGFSSMLAAVLIAMNKKKVKGWLNLHQNIGLAGAGLGVAGLLFGVYMVEEATGVHFHVGHAYLGLVTILFAVTTPSLRFLAMRQKQHMKDLMLAHRWCGRITLLLMLITILSGLVVALG